MKEVLRQCIGIDCAKDEHVASFAVMHPDRKVEQLSTLKFPNSKAGFEKFSQWVKKFKPIEELTIIMEATGVYHEQIACYLDDKGFYVIVVLANKAKHFSKTLDIKTVNDKVSAQSLATMGLEKRLDRWKKPSPLYNNLRQLTRERDQLIQERSQIKCQLHAEKSGAWPNKGSIKRMKDRIEFINKQITEVLTAIKKLIDSDPELKRKISYVCTIKGVGLITAATVIAETNGFNLIRNKQQLVSYSGLDIKEHTSGTSVHKKARISHHGNKYLRKCLHFPALTAIRHSKDPKALFIRLVSKHGIKMKAAVAVQRKILILIYTLWKNETVFDPDYEIKKSRNELGQSRKTALMELA
jgi:transposase